MGNKKKRNFNLIFGGILTGTIVFVSLLSLVYTPYDPDAMDAAGKFAGISLSHPMGCDNFGRDILSRVMVGTRNTLFVALGTVAMGTFFGAILGAFTGYFGGILDEILMRINDAFFAFPSILLALVIVSLLGSGKYRVMLALGIAFIPSFARIVRAEFLKNRELDYVKSVRLMGAGSFRIMFVHILPNTAKVLAASVMIGFNNAVLAEAGMSFLGIGVQPPDASLGRMLSEAQTYLFSTPSYAFFPGMVIVFMVMGFSLLSEGITQKTA